MTSETPSQRTVAFLDILGFRGLLRTTPLSELANTYERRISEAGWLNRPVGQPSLFPEHHLDIPLCQLFVFSDSIILVSNDDQAISALKLLVFARRLSQQFIAFKMPLRGGITFGELYSNPKQNICLGRALTAAYDLERNQSWIGVSIDTSVTKAFPELLLSNKKNRGIIDDIFLQYPVPMKDNISQFMRTLNWRFNLIVEKGTRSLFVNDGPADVMQKVENTLKYAESVVRSGRVYVEDQSKLPVEFRSMYIGATEPPFPHGDDL